MLRVAQGLRNAIFVLEAGVIGSNGDNQSAGPSFERAKRRRV